MGVVDNFDGAVRIVGALPPHSYIHSYRLFSHVVIVSFGSRLAF